MRYTIRKTTKTTARIGIESSSSLDPTRKPEIWRFFPGDTSLAEMSKGAVLGREAGKTCAYVLHVTRNDLICIREKFRGFEDHSWRYFRIGSQFEPFPLNLPNRCLSKRECSDLLEIEESVDLDQIDDDQGIGLRRFFSQKHPDWLEEIAERQIRHWHQNKPEPFFRFARAEAAYREISRCVAESPFAALERFQHLLDKAQLAHCLRSCPKAAVMFAADKIPNRRRQTYLLNHAKEALVYGSDKLTDKELSFCASIDMFTAFRLRTRMPPHRRAILLANSYIICFFENKGRPLDALQEEIRVSIIEFPGQWRASDPGGFPSILTGLRDRVEMKFDPEIINAIFEKADPKDQQALAQFIAQGI